MASKATSVWGPTIVESIVRTSYCGPPPAAGDWMRQWNFDPVLLGGIAVLLVVALRLPRERRGAGLGAAGLLVAAFVSPLCALTTALFSARSVHHLVLVGGVAPLLALAWPRRGGAAIGCATLAIPLWAWHVPLLYDAALSDTAVYWAMQIALVAGAWRFWTGIAVAPAPVALAAATAGVAQMGLLGALLTFAQRPLYAPHLATTVSYGVGPLGDQQLAGLIMWVPGMVLFAVAGAGLAWPRIRVMRAAAA